MHERGQQRELGARARAAARIRCIGSGMFLTKSYQWSIMCVCGVRKLRQVYRNELLKVLIKIYYVKVVKQVFFCFY